MTDADEAARRIVALHEAPKKRPTIEELEAILQQPDARVTIHPDGSVGEGTSDALTVARAYLAATARIEALEAALMEAENIARHGCLVPPDGGSPTENERLMCEDIAHRIRVLKDQGLWLNPQEKADG